MIMRPLVNSPYCVHQRRLPLLRPDHLERHRRLDRASRAAAGLEGHSRLLAGLQALEAKCIEG